MDNNEIALQLTLKVLETNHNSLFDYATDNFRDKELAKNEAEIICTIFNTFKEKLNY